MQPDRNLQTQDMDVDDHGEFMKGSKVLAREVFGGEMSFWAWPSWGVVVGVAWICSSLALLPEKADRE